MGKLKNELKIYYSAISVRIMYAIVAVCIIGMFLLMPFKRNEALLAPGTFAQASLGILFGVVIVYMTGKVWENDLRRGTIINILSSGTSRTEYFLSKLGVLVVQCLAFSIFVSAIVLVLTGLFGSGTIECTFFNALVSNILSWILVFMTYIAESLIATVFFMAINSFSYAFVAAIAFVIAEYFIAYFYMAKSLTAVLPITIFFRLVKDINPDTAMNVFVHDSWIIVLYILVAGAICFVLNKRNEY